MTVRVAVIGHVEWMLHARGAMPDPGGITHLDEPLEQAGGGGAVAALAAAALGAECHLFTALADDRNGRDAAAALADQGVRLHVAWRAGATQTRGLSVVGGDGDRSIAVIGAGLDPSADDRLPWSQLADCGAVYFTGRDPRTLRAARAAPWLVVSARRQEALAHAALAADVVVGSAADPSERIRSDRLRPAPDAVVATEGPAGGEIRWSDGRQERWAATPPPGPLRDSYGCGDSFAAGLTVALAAGDDLATAAQLGARCGAACATLRGMSARALAPLVAAP